jgi:hypothetical protein
MIWFVRSTRLPVEFASVRRPKCDEPGEPSVLPVVEWELVSSKAIEPVGHFGEDLQVKSVVLVRGGEEEPIETESIFDSHQVDEVPSLGSPESAAGAVYGLSFGALAIPTTGAFRGWPPSDPSKPALP